MNALNSVVRNYPTNLVKKKSTYVNHHYFIPSNLDIQYSFSYYARQNLANTALLIELFTNLILFLSTGMESSYIICNKNFKLEW